MKSKLLVLALGCLLAVPAAQAAKDNPGRFLDNDTVRQMGGVGNIVDRDAMKKQAQPVEPQDTMKKTEKRGKPTSRTEGFNEDFLVSVSDNLRFETDSAELKPEGRRELSRLGRMLSQDPDQKIVISGHADAVGPSEYNADLSVKRAESVRGILLNSGASQEQIELEGFGESQPIADNSDPSGRAQNRRVELSTG